MKDAVGAPGTGGDPAAWREGEVPLSWSRCRGARVHRGSCQRAPRILTALLPGWSVTG